MTYLTSYRDLCSSKRAPPMERGIMRTPELSAGLFDHQRHGIEFALRAGSSALFYDTGLGKTRMMLEWGKHVVEQTNKPVLMLAPLAVGEQHLREAAIMGIDAVASRFGGVPSGPKISITNYERLDKFDPADFGGVILDESSILKSFSGVTSRKFIGTELKGNATTGRDSYFEQAVKNLKQAEQESPSRLLFGGLSA